MFVRKNWWILIDWLVEGYGSAYLRKALITIIILFIFYYNFTNCIKQAEFPFSGLGETY